MAAGDDSARHALALVQSLRDVGTRVPHIVLVLARGSMGSDDCKFNYSWRVSIGRETVLCQSPLAIEPEVVSRVYLAAFARLGVETVMVDSVPETPYTEKLAGGRSTFWGMALQK